MYLLEPAGSALAVTPNDTVDLDPVARGLYVGGAGAVKVDLEAGGTVTFSAVPVGTILPIMAKRVYATGTTATNLIALN